jgi:thymidylate synthase (FAD)
MRVRVLDEEKGTFTTGHIGDVVEKGVQPVYEVALEDGKTITMTANHRVFTREGWATMGEAVGLVGDGEAARTTRECFLMTNGVPVYQDREWMRARRREGLSVTEIAEQAGCSYHTVRKWLGVHELRFTPEERRGRPAWNRGLRGYSTGYRMTERHRSAIRSARSGVKSNFWRGGVTSERASIGRWTREQAARVHEAFEHTCQACGSRGGTLHAHHIVPVWYDPTLARAVSNLITVCDSCHRDLHSAVESELDFARRHAASGFEELPVLPNRKGVKLAAHPVRVVSVTFVGLRQTYDLCIEGPWHNFVANGVVVHNSFNEFSMRYAKATDEFYVPAAEDVRSQVGKPGAYSFEPVEDELAAHTREELRKVYDLAYTTYEQLVEAGVARELARAVLPVGAYTEFYWTVNARSLMNFLSLRSAEAAQREIRRYAEACEQLFATAMPVTYEAFVANERRAP